MINGTTVQQNTLQNMFHSVQLNVNNPHFLIMQGRITKVLNMKPQETLSMIEEAAGTRMYEAKKQAATKTIEKKQLKVDEITKCIEEEITPTLENLRTERQDYHKWQANNSEFERLDRIVIAFEYRNAEEKVQSSENDKQKLVDEQNALNQVQEDKNAQAAECDRKIAEIQRVRDEDVEGGLQELKKRETDLSKDLVKLNTLATNQKETLAGEKDSLAALTKQMDAATRSLAEKTKEFDACSTKLAAKEAESTASEGNYKTLQEKYQNACAGVADETSAELLSLPEQVSVWEKKDRESESQINQCQQKAQHSGAQLKELKASNKKQATAHSAIIKENEILRAAIAAAEAKLNKLSFTEADETSTRNRIGEVRNARSQLRDVVENSSAAVETRLRFDFKDPERGFDRSRVKGLVAKLFRITDRNAATALELAAGGKLYQVVIDNEQTGRLLIDKGQLRSRCTFIPLSVVNAYTLPADKVARAKKIAASLKGTAFVATELITCDPSVQKAMNFVFGTSIICSSAEIAKTIAFDPSVRLRTVSLDGDQYDPSGTLTGGSKNQLGVLLNKMEELAEASEQMAVRERELRDLETRLVSMEREVALSRDLAADLEIKRHALRLSDEKIAESSFAQSMGQITEIEAQLVGFDEEVRALQAQQAKAKEELRKLKAAESNIKKAREHAMKDMEGTVRAAQKASSALKAEVMKLRNARDAAQAEVKNLTQELHSLKEQQAISESANSRLADESESLAQRVSLFCIFHAHLFSNFTILPRS